MMMARLALVCLLCSLVPAAGATTGGDHVRVVLDISLSMSRRLDDGTGPNDPGRLAVLATMLLHDLVEPNPRHQTAPDSFVVMPFKKDWPKWVDPDQPPPTGIGTPIQVTGNGASDRAAFWDRLHNLPYDGRWTYFHPGVRAALDSLLVQDVGRDDRRVIVLVTDGLPEQEIRERDQALLLELREEMINADVQLYVLAFGPSATRERAFFDALFEGRRGEILGDLFPDPTGDDLVVSMAEIFSRSFGYVVERMGPGPRRRPVDLDGDVTPPQVAVVALARGDVPAPDQAINPSLSTPGPVRAREWGAAYSVQIIEGVRSDEDYQLTTDQDGVDLAILRKVAPKLSVLPGFVMRDDGQVPMTQARRVVAETPFALKLLAASPTGTSGGQAADLEVWYNINGPRHEGPCRYQWENDLEGVDLGSRTRFGRGVTFDAHMTFGPDEDDPGQVYKGYIHAYAGLRGERVGKLECDQAHDVDVYPKIAIRPVPPDGFLEPQTLGMGGHGCVSFRLEMEQPKRLAVLNTETFRLRAHVGPSDPRHAQGALAGARIQLDGEEVGYVNQATPWHEGPGLSQDRLLGEHELCVDLGRPQIQEPTDDLALTLHFQLAHTPYDDFRAVDPFRAKLRVMPVPVPKPGEFPWDAFWALFWVLLAALAALALLARRHALPKDLGYCLSSESGDLHGEAGDARAGVPRLAALQALPALSWWQPIPLPFSRQRRPIQDPGSDHIVAWVQPLDKELFGLKPARGVSVRELDGGLLPVERRVVQIQIHHDYLLHGKNGRWHFRMGYLRSQDGPPSA